MMAQGSRGVVIAATCAVLGGTACLPGPHKHEEYVGCTDDQGCPTGQYCVHGFCVRSEMDGGSATCDDGVAPEMETCFNRDEDSDCDGIVGNVPGLGDPCVDEEALGVCQRGTMLCNGGELPECITAQPGPEVCDGQDNNCNGIADDGFDLLTDPANCGECGAACSPALTCCQGQCRNLQTSDEACGECGIACGSERACCGGSCVDLDRNNYHCGDCGHQCGHVPDLLRRRVHRHPHPPSTTAGGADGPVPPRSSAVTEHVPPAVLDVPRPALRAPSAVATAASIRTPTISTVAPAARAVARATYAAAASAFRAAHLATAVHAACPAAPASSVATAPASIKTKPTAATVAMSATATSAAATATAPPSMTTTTAADASMHALIGRSASIICAAPRATRIVAAPASTWKATPPTAGPAGLRA
jgi:hypothetical protein